MWSLSPDIRHLNHGSFSAVPVEVQQAQDEWRKRWEANTTAFIFNDYQPALDRARQVLARFVGADEAGLVFVRNATTGVASVVRSLEPSLKPGDELLTTSQDYNAVRQTLEYTAMVTGARVVVVDVPFPMETREQVTEAVLGRINDRTKLAVIDHITSPTGVVFPIEDIVQQLEPDVPVLVDGAHAPGQVPLALDALGASWYTGNLHKWLCAPKGSAFLHTRDDKIGMTVPTVISHGWNAPLRPGGSRYQALFDWLGTDDNSPWLTVPDAIRVGDSLEPGGWPALMERNHRLALEARDLLNLRLGTAKTVPDEMVGSMATIPLPDREGADPGGIISPLNLELLDAGFETMVMNWPEWPRQLLRISAYHYNSIEEYAALADELTARAG